MGFNPFEEIGKTAAGAGAFLQEQGANVAHAVSDGAGQAAKAANDAGDFLAEQGNNAARAIGDGAGRYRKRLVMARRRSPKERATLPTMFQMR